MAIVKDSLGRSPFWYCAYTNEKGVRTKVSLKTEDKQEAEVMCKALEEAARAARLKTASEAQFRRLISDTLEHATGKKIDDPTVRQWLDRWLASEKSAIAKATFERYQQVSRDFLACIGPV